LISVYQLQQEAPTAEAVTLPNDCETINKSNRPPYFKNEYHGCLTNQEAKALLDKDGQFLIRDSGKTRQPTLSLKFNNEIKHYR